MVRRPELNGVLAVASIAKRPGGFWMRDPADVASGWDVYSPQLFWPNQIRNATAHTAAARSAVMTAAAATASVRLPAAREVNPTASAEIPTDTMNATRGREAPHAGSRSSSSDPT